MKFENVVADVGSEVKLNGATLIKSSAAIPCVVCGTPTSWCDKQLTIPVCEEICHRTAWRKQHEYETKLIMEAHVQKHRESIIQELQYVESCEDKLKDILIVVHNQLDYVKVCLNSVVNRTKNYKIYLWDNGSDPETQTYLQQFEREHFGRVVLIRSETNVGFIEPNNEMARLGSGEYLILLNSDTQVFEGWDTAMLGFLQNNTRYGQVGYLGGLLLEDGRGEGGDFGESVDYIAGFCACVPRAIYTQLGLFSSEYRFAYFEDSDLSLRLKASGYKIFALHLMLVTHYQNKTVKAVEKAGTVDLAASFRHNQLTFQSKWSSYLKAGRVLTLQA